MTATPNNEAVGVAYPMGSDREVLLYLMQQFDCETWQCPQCGHAEDTATTDSALYLRDYLAKSATLTPSPADAEKPVEVSGYIATVPDNCDRIIWRGHYHHLPTTPPASVPVSTLLPIVQQAIERARVFDDGSDGADAESARSVVAILTKLTAIAQEHGNG
jgi:hypothetical protein